MDYSVKNTNKEQRKDLVKKALAISISGADVPTKETIELAKKYIDGSIELEDLQKQFDVYKAKMESLLISQLELLKDSNKE